MRDSTLFRMAGVAAVTGGLLRIASEFVTGRIGTAHAQELYFAIDAALILGLFGIYLWARRSWAPVILIGFGTAVVGFLMVRSAALFGGYQTGASVTLVGVVIIGWCAWRDRLLRVAPILWTLSLIAGIAAALAQAAVLSTAAGVLFAFGFVSAGFVLVRPSPARECETASART